jgi:NAD(P)-dependent dehydrogenase (short-subunit alcohol dehydrogenase family)
LRTYYLRICGVRVLNTGLARVSEQRSLELSGKVAIVTGGSSGIGKAIVELFVAEGANVVVADVQGGVFETAPSSEGPLLYVKTDVRSEQDAKELVAKTKARFGGIDILCNNAGIELLRPLTETTEEEWDRVLDTNLKGAFLVSKHAIPEMIKRGGGTIVNTASQLGLFGLENFTAYCASKGGLVVLTKAMALEYARQNVRVNCVCPGPIVTPMFERELLTEKDPEAARKAWAAKQPIGRLGRPEEIAEAVLFLASEKSSFAVGHALVVDGGYTLN